MKSFPHYSQHDVMDCGPTCLRVVSAFYGKRYSLEGLREKSFITREGASMLGINKAVDCNRVLRSRGVSLQEWVWATFHVPEVYSFSTLRYVLT